MTLSGRIAVMRGGALEQVAPPLEIYAARQHIRRALHRRAGDEPATNSGRRNRCPGRRGRRHPAAGRPSRSRRSTARNCRPRRAARARFRAPPASGRVEYPLLAVVSGPVSPAVGADVFVTLPADRLHISTSGMEAGWAARDRAFAGYHRKWCDRRTAEIALSRKALIIVRAFVSRRYGLRLPHMTVVGPTLLQSTVPSAAAPSPRTVLPQMTVLAHVCGSSQTVSV